MNRLEYYWSKLLKKIRMRAFVNVKLHQNSKVCSGSQLVNVNVDKHSDIGYDCIIINTDIGAFCSLGANIIIGGASHTIDWVSTSPVFNENKDHLKKKFAYHKFSLDSKTIIGNDVWIGNNVLIKSDIKIGDGAVLGMGSVVTKDVGPYEIWAGNPARLVRKRFEEEKIKSLLEIKWWNWKDNEIEANADLFNDLDLFLNRQIGIVAPMSGKIVLQKK